MLSINQKKAEKIAIGFLEQYHDTSTIESIFLENGVWVVTAKIGLMTPQVRQVLIDENSGRILSYVDKTAVNGNSIMKQAKVASAVEKALLRIGPPAHEKVVQKLYDDYHCHLFDCYEKPEYLNKVIKEIFGDNYIVIVESIKDQLKETTEQKTFMDFLTIISK
ncbi:MAG TPA: hypothetical protein VIG05_00080 [Candidatus Nitrosotenuis sp.]